MEPIRRRSFLGSLVALFAAPFLVPKAPIRGVPEVGTTIPGFVEPQDVVTWSGRKVAIYIDGLDPEDPKHQRLIKETISEYCQRLPDGPLWLPI